MTKEVLEMIKETLNNKEQQENIVDTIYKHIWNKALFDYYRDESNISCYVYLSDELNAYPLLNKNEYDKLINMLENDGFKFIVNKNNKIVLSIRKAKIKLYSNKQDNTEIITKKIITPFAETRRKK